jgi:hypothetical protein
MKKLLLVLSLLLANSAFASGVPASFTYQGIVMNSAGTAPLTSVVSLKLSIYDPTGACLLYQEQQANIDLSQTNGTFAVQVGSSVGAAKRVGGTDQGLAMPAVFANNGQILATSTTGCTAGYTPAANDGRLLRVAVTNGGSTVTISPDLQINSVPNALVAETLQGQTPSQIFHAPTVSVFTSGSGTYTVPTGTHFLKIEMVGGGGGGGGAGGNGSNAPSIVGGSGGNTTFGGFLTAGGGLTDTSGSGGIGGVASIGSPAIAEVQLAGHSGPGWFYDYGTNAPMIGQTGGQSPFGGAGVAGTAATANSGSGGGGGSTNSASGIFDGPGGASGGYVKAIISSPVSTYSYTVGAGGTAGPALSNGSGGGGGGSGIIIVEAY